MLGTPANSRRRYALVLKFSKVAEAFGVHAEKLTDPAAVNDVLSRCVRVVRDGRSALLHVRVTPL